jgi:hypothetical protein
MSALHVLHRQCWPTRLPALTGTLVEEVRVLKKPACSIRLPSMHSWPAALWRRMHTPAGGGGGGGVAVGLA